MIPNAVYIFVSAWLALVVVASIIHRRRKGKPIFMPKFEQPLFLEPWRSGRSLRSIVTRIGHAQRCLWIAVTPDAVHIHPHCPFCLMFLPLIYNLDHTIAGTAICAIEPHRGFLGTRTVGLT